MGSYKSLNSQVIDVNWELFRLTMLYSQAIWETIVFTYFSHMMLVVYIYIGILIYFTCIVCIYIMFPHVIFVKSQKLLVKKVHRGQPSIRSTKKKKPGMLMFSYYYRCW